ncbi:hypothetical protein ACFQ08_38595, partial [Streptosporangium algeriense]
MGLAAIVTWLITAMFGVRLLRRWLFHGGPRGQVVKVTRFPAALLFAHPMLAMSALGCWGAYLVTTCRVLAWLAFGTLALTALLGFTMSTRWLG